MRWSDLAGNSRVLDTQALLGEVLPAEEENLRIAALYPPRGRFVSVDGVDLHYVEMGSGRPVVFFHGAGGMLDELVASPLAELLAERYRVIVFDRPGYGHSSRPRPDLAGPRAQARLIHRALAELEIERPIVVGHSWGGAMALSYAAQFQASMSALVVLAGWAFPARQAAILLFSLPWTPFLGGLVRRVVWPALARTLAPEIKRRVFAPNLVPPRFDGGFPLEMALRPSQLMADAEDVSLLNPSVARLAAAYPTIRLPVELVSGDADMVVGAAEHVGRLSTVLPDARLTLIEGVGHMLHHVAPKPVRRAIDRAAARSAWGVSRRSRRSS